MYLFILGQVLNIAGWQLGLSTIAIIISFTLMVWKIDRARKTDFKAEIGKKADMSVVKSELKLRDQSIKTLEVQINEHEKNNISEFRSIQQSLEEVHSQLEYNNKKVDDIYKILISKS